MTQPDVTILIVTHNSAAVIVSCVEAALRTGAAVLAIDNASQDATLELLQQQPIAVISNLGNRGFAAAVNQGVRATTTPLLLILNPDAILQTKLDALSEVCRSPEVGVVGGQLVSQAGVPQNGFHVRRFPTPWTLFFETLGFNRLWPNNPVNWRYRCLDLDLTRAAEVDQPAGAFLMFRRNVWEGLGGFDEGFFPIWFEDVDFCKRVHDAGFHARYTPLAVAVHAGAHSIARIGIGKRTEYWYCSLLRYSIRHFHPRGRILACLGVIGGSLLRMVLGGRPHRSRVMIRTYFAVMNLALRSMWTRKVRFGEVFL